MQWIWIACLPVVPGGKNLLPKQDLGGRDPPPPPPPFPLHPCGSEALPPPPPFQAIRDTCEEQVFCRPRGGQTLSSPPPLQAIRDTCEEQAFCEMLQAVELVRPGLLFIPTPD